MKVGVVLNDDWAKDEKRKRRQRSGEKKKSGQKFSANFASLRK